MVEMEVGGIVFGRLSNLECWFQRPGEERLSCDMAHLTTGMVLGIGEVVSRHNLAEGKRINGTLSATVMLELDTRLIRVPDEVVAAAKPRAERGAEILAALDADLVKDVEPVLPPEIEAGLKKLEEAWGITLSCEMVDVTHVALTLSNFLGGFLGWIEGTREEPALFMGVPKGDAVDEAMAEWAASPEAFLQHFGWELTEYIGWDVVDLLSAGQRRRLALAARCRYDTSAFAQ